VGNLLVQLERTLTHPEPEFREVLRVFRRQ